VGAQDGHELQASLGAARGVEGGQRVFDKMRDQESDHSLFVALQPRTANGNCG